jgi:hypothetical protein
MLKNCTQLQSFIELLISTIVGLRNKIEDQIANVKIKQGEKFMEAKL